MERMTRMASASLRGSFSGHKELQQLLAAETSTKQAWKAYLRAQYEMYKCLLKWAEGQPPGIRDRLAAIATTQFMLLDKERAYTDQIKARRQVFANILSNERVCDTFRRDQQKLDRQLASAQRDVDRSRRKGSNTSAAESKIQQIQDRIEVTVSQLSLVENELKSLIGSKTKDAFVQLMEAENQMLRLRASVNECLKCFLLGGDASLTETAQLLIQPTTSEEGPNPEMARRRMSMLSVSAVSEDPPPYSVL